MCGCSWALTGVCFGVAVRIYVYVDVCSHNCVNGGEHVCVAVSVCACGCVVAVSVDMYVLVRVCIWPSV